MRLNRYLAQCGIASRRGADELIAAGKVRVNGEIITNLATRVDPERDRVEVGGGKVLIPDAPVYLMLNKPSGCDVTRRDSHSPANVFRHLPADLPASVQYVGRLDRDTTGLLLFTNDGELAHRLAHPSHGVEKEYLCFGPKPPMRSQLERLTGAVHLEDGPARADRADRVRARLPEGVSPPALRVAPDVLRIVLHLGRKRIVRRMCEAVGFELAHLHRTRVGPVELGGLPIGKHRTLTESEIGGLHRATSTRARRKR